MRLEVGYGLEGQITDALSRRILDNVLRPFLRENRAGDGIVAVVGAVAESVGSQWRPAQVQAPRRYRASSQEPLPSLGRVLFMICFIVAAIVLWAMGMAQSDRPGFRRRYGSNSWGSGGSGGSSWGGGGGSFGGGGASSDW
jgi:uncharacterized protein